MTDKALVVRKNLIALWLLILAVGCQAEGAAPVSGRVTLDGKPLPGVHVSFQPEAAGPDAPGGSYAVTDNEGKYALRLVDSDAAGAAVGKHRVEIVAKTGITDDSDRRGRPPELSVVVPPRYNRNSELTFEVPAGGTQDANFDLSSR